MPGSVSNASPSDVLPEFICRQLTASREFLARRNDYKGGETQVALVASTSRKSFSGTVRLSPANMATWRAFFEAHVHEPFYLYYPWETDPKWSHDPTGVASDGRYTVRFDGGWEQAMSIGRGEVSVRLVEVN